MTKFILTLFICIIGAGAVTYFNGNIFSDNRGNSNAKKISWQPKLNAQYPDLDLIDHSGQRIKFSDFKGKVIIVEPIGMSCHACNAFAGGDKKGGFKGNGVQNGLSSLETVLPQFAKGTRLDNPNIVFISLLLYDLKSGAPTQTDAKLWAEHFGFDKKKNSYVVVPTQDMRSNTAYNMIPGFHLIDKNFILRSDSTGHHPKDDLYRKLFPMVPKLLKQ